MAIEANFNKLLFLKKFNNYFNRKVIGFPSVSGYVNAVTDYQVRENINFNPNEGTLSEIVINDLPFEPDYCLVLGSYDRIESRWFVIEVKRTRKAQAHISLKRDVIYDYLPALLDAPIYVHKAMLEETDPFILNDEGMSLNQIKKNEYLLKDRTECPWLVIYYAKNTPSQTVITKHFSFSFPGNFDNVNYPSDEPYNIVVIPFGYLPYAHKQMNMIYTWYRSVSQKKYALEIVQGIIETFGSSIYDVQLLPYYPLQDTILFDNYVDNRYAVDSIFVGFEHDNDGNDVISSYTREDFEETEVTISGVEYLKFTKHCHLDDLGVFPAYDLTLTVNSITCGGIDTDGYTINASDFTSSYSDHTFVVGSWTFTDGIDVEILIRKSKKLNQFQCAISVAATNTTDRGQGTFGVFIQHNQFEANLKQPDDLIPQNTSLKVLSNCYRYRLVSPNYQGTFEINVGKNGGLLNNFKALCTYKPFTPMIKVAPQYNLLYGSNFKDDRGLICSSNFSITMITSQWVEYQLQNKNYQNIFNRDIQNLDFKQDIAMRETIVGGVVGTMQGALAGAAAGGMAAGSFGAPAGAITGAAIGAAASGIAAAADVEFLGMKQREERSYAIDKYNYQLGNIKAIPNTLTKVTSFDILCKIFPFVEKYSCTDKELKAFNDKIKYESMTVMRIDKILNFYNKYQELCYFKGELIRTDDIAADSHIVDVIYQELMKGVFL